MQVTPAALGLGSTPLDQFYYAILTTVTVVENANVISSSDSVEVPDGLAGIDTTQLASQAALAAASAATGRTEHALHAADYLDHGHESADAGHVAGPSPAGSSSRPAPVDTQSSENPSATSG
jgi:hypothetical protein